MTDFDPNAKRREPAPLHELIDEDLPESEVDRLRVVDAVLRRVPAPPGELPPRLRSVVAEVTQPRGIVLTRRRTLVAIALAAALAALTFGIGLSAGSDDFDESAAIPMAATDEAPDAAATIRLGERDENGNWPIRLEVSGLKELPEGGYYTLALTKRGEFGALCGSFRMGEGETEAEWTVSYRLADYDTWVVTAYLPDEPRQLDRPALLEVDVPSSL